MHISKLAIVNFRNFASVNFEFNEGINTIIGENGSGKTNVFRAIRLLLDDSLSRSSTRLNEGDFNRGLDNWRGHWIIVSIEFKNLSPEESIQSLFLHSTGDAKEDHISTATYNLIFRPNALARKKLSELAAGDFEGLAEVQASMSIKDYETVFTGRSSANFKNPEEYKAIVGDFLNVSFPDKVDESAVGSKISSFFNLTDDISFTYIKALRDVVSDFQSNRRNPLLTLLKGKSEQLNRQEFDEIVGKVKELNSSIEGLSDVKDVRTDIHDTINNTAGDTYAPDKLSIKSDLPEEDEQLFKSLKLIVGESNDGYEGPIYELSLGGANLIFLTLKLLEFKYQQKKESFANFLLIEEPEAHLHTHIQKTLFDKIAFNDTQIIYSTHSTHISDVSNIQNMNIINRIGSVCEVYQPHAGLDAEKIVHVQRYLDAIRSNLLFAKSVILVEGDAEEILIPQLVKVVLGISLDELGVSVINVRSTGFENVACLFHDDRIRKRCAIITDLDSAFIDLELKNDDDEPSKNKKVKAKRSQARGAERAEKLRKFCDGSNWLNVFYAENTFEVQFIESGNESIISSLIDQVYTDENTKTTARKDISSGDKVRYGTRALTMASNVGKGWFAIQLSEEIDSSSKIPSYISQAIAFTQNRVSNKIFSEIVGYRISESRSKGMVPAQDISTLVDALDQFNSGNLERNGLVAEFCATFPSDPAIETIQAI